ncbi:MULTISPECIES: glycoside hydrolase family 3 N-terminal domain-containing protein [Xanthomonas]|uniref:beta-glucosidase n=1 Tax=Xanthomonas dyei TaxID=743699 RepID=A0ABZ0DCS8_9XANT|nr:glycoside hydrolase family 3 N-terminal domain-containing protein [Xanthomonas dyei]MCC4635702.1 glycoside hydrolase family 3 C-terminal domain-containing protein [Xanthomonas dyei pv. eucalypti]WOB27597.1 glycoside hydrolase family 3 C-terminal domain-containing protein [Xanthomonas dyei]WOB55219.1 glycoside hydrolase family 3 C-terminal domain-containing protein [Xanthomonas dyei]
MHPRTTRRQLLRGAATLAVLSRIPSGWALPPGPSHGPAFIEALIARMSVEEKAGQLSLFSSAEQVDKAIVANPVRKDAAGRNQLAAARAGRLTGVFNGSNVRWHQQLQQAALKSRLQIPLFFAADVIHGFTTVFPVPLAEAASFEPALAQRTARAAAMEASAVGIDWTFAPMVDIARDARWGRGVEGAGEDVLLAQRFAQARVRGFQGDAGLAHADALAACPKHFAAYGAAEGGLDYSTVDISERTLREVYLPPFQAAFAAGAVTTMAAFNALSGVPATANAWLLGTVLRQDLRYTGLVVSDFTADKELVAHGIAADDRDAARLAFLAGVDISMESGLYLQHLPALVAAGAISMQQLDASVRRVLCFKAALGLFDDPFRRIQPARAQPRQRRADSMALAREAAHKSMVLLKNDGELLPLRRSGQRIALIGPMARDWVDHAGPWSLFDQDDRDNTVAAALSRTMTDPQLLQVVDGSGFDRPLPGGVQAAVAAARSADVALLAIGEPMTYSGEAQSRTEICIPQVQQQLLAAVAATGTPVVLLLSTGRALALQGPALQSAAILVTWFLGSEAGNAIADIVFGVQAPSGRLPVSFPHAAGQIPYTYAHPPSGRPNLDPHGLQPYTTHYRGVPNTALFPFGHGLTYGRIAYTDLQLSAPQMTATGSLQISARISNHGSRDADEVVQLYLRDRTASVVRPVRELKDFRKVRVPAGGNVTVQFELRRAHLLFVGQAMAPIVEPGLFDVWLAPSAEADGLSASFELLG